MAAKLWWGESICQIDEDMKIHEFKLRSLLESCVVVYGTFMTLGRMT